MEDVDGPLLSVGRYEPLQRRQPFRLADSSLTQEGPRLLPELVDVRYLIEQQDPPSAVVSGDFIQASAPYDLCWNEVIAGCPIRWKTGHVWSEAFLTDVDYPGGPPLAELLPLFRRINAHKPLIITGPVSHSELDMLLQSLSPRGICLQVTLHRD